MARRQLETRSSKRRNKHVGASRRPSLRQAFANADRITRELSARRKQRNTGMSRQFAISDAEPYDAHVDDFPAPTILLRLIRLVTGALLLPLCIVTTLTLFQRDHISGFLSEFWHTAEFVYFTVGCFIMAVWFFLVSWARPHFLYLYVLGHELTHAVFVIFCLGKVSGFRASREGGYIMTNRSNFLIALSPYFVPFWSIIALALYSLIHWVKPIPHGENILLFTLGVTWCFHLIWTVWMIPKDQPDLKENGTLWSLLVIYLANVALLAAMLIIASPTLTWKLFLYNWGNNLFQLIESLENWIR